MRDQLKRRWKASYPALYNVGFGIIMAMLATLLYKTISDTNDDQLGWGGVGCVAAGLFSFTYKCALPIKLNRGDTFKNKMIALGDAHIEQLVGIIGFTVSALSTEAKVNSPPSIIFANVFFVGFVDEITRLIQMIPFKSCMASCKCCGNDDETRTPLMGLN